MAAASHAAFTLVVDCPVFIHIGSDIARTIFIDDGTTVEFTGAGKFTVDNVLLPAFAIANSSNITLTDWNLEYDASLPVNPNVGGYTNGGTFEKVTTGAAAQPSGAFNNLRMTPWLTANRAITFDHSQGDVTSTWPGPTNTSAVFYIAGDTSDLTVTGLKVYVPATAGGDRFVPMVFSMIMDYKSNQTVTAKTPITSEYVAIPHNLTFSNISFNGTYMGWQGNAANTVFENIQSRRYGDLQDANGENVGGVGDWFAPPHLFYLNDANSEDSKLFNNNIQIENVVDQGPRVGKARSTKSGNALSLKIGCVDCSVNNYQSSRLDGFMDVLSSNGLTISNVTATYNSAFEDNQWPAWRFPSSGYTNVKFENIVLQDLSADTIEAPIYGADLTSNAGMVFENVQVAINRWSGNSKTPLPLVAGSTNTVALTYTIANTASRVMAAQKGTGSLTLTATPASLSKGGSTVLTWTSKDISSCSTSGAWSGTTATSGSRTMTMPTAGTYNFTLTCQNGTSSSSASMPVVVH
jgi:hypothetical protein